MANTSAPQLFSGARGKIVLGSTTLALVTNISVSEQEGLRPTHVVGEYHPVSIDPLSYDVSVSIGRIVPVAKSDGTAQNAYTGTQLGLEPTLDKVLSQDSVDIIIYDKNPVDKTEYTVAKIVGCRFTGRSTSVSSGDIASESYNFTGLLNRGYGGDTSSTTGEDGSLPIGYGLDSTT
jgi:hypothetical protein